MFVTFERQADNSLVVLEREDGTSYTVQASVLPPQAKPGDCLELTEEGTYRLAPDNPRRNKVEQLWQELWPK